MLEVEGIETSYGAVRALKGVSLDVNPGEIVTLLGANGAGKSTTIRTITGLVRPSRGRISFMGREITRLDPEDIARLGIACVPEGRHIFAGLSVQDNLLLGATPRGKVGKVELTRDLDEVYGIFPILKDFRDRPGWQLSGGQQQMLAIGRGLMSRPKFLLLDEPSLGLAPVLVQEVFDVIKRISLSGTTILLVEQNARMALSIANRGFVLASGNMVLADTAANLLSNEEMGRHYLGVRSPASRRIAGQPPRGVSETGGRFGWGIV